MTHHNTHQVWDEHYRAGQTPWDTGITPPEVIEFWRRNRLPTTALVLDLGCGTATNVAYLARLGLWTIGVEFAATALARGQQRLKEAALADPNRLLQACLIQADVSQLPVAQLNAQYMLDVGCFHGLYAQDRPGYVEGVIRNLAPGGYYHLYAFDRVDELRNDPARSHRGVEEEEIVERFTPALQVVEIQRAKPERYPCRWYLLQKG